MATENHGSAIQDARKNLIRSGEASWREEDRKWLAIRMVQGRFVNME